MRKLSILFSFFLLCSTAVFAACDSITVNSVTVIDDGGVFKVEVEINNENVGGNSNVTINPTFVPIGAFTITVTTPAAAFLPFGISNKLFTITNPGVLQDIKDGNIITIQVGAFFDFSGGGLSCTETKATAVNENTWGCSDPNAFNYESTVTLDLGNCITSICSYLGFMTMDIIVDAPDTLFRVIMRDTLEGFPLNQIVMEANITGTGGQTFDVFDPPTTFNMTPAINNVPGVGIVEFPIETELRDLVGDSLYLTGTFIFKVVVNNQLQVCTLNLDWTVDISRIGCTDNTAFNYDPYNTIDDGDCISFIEVDPFIVQPPCLQVPGSVNIEDAFTIGGTPPYDFEYYTVDPNAVGPGQYLFTITDNTPASENGPIIKHVLIDVITPPEFYVIIDTVLPFIVATVNNPVTKYYWLLDGVLIDSTYTNTYAYVDTGIYSCYVEGMGENGCWDYSNEIGLSMLDIDENMMDWNLSIYPNPVRSELTLTGLPSSAGRLDYQVVNAIGASVLRGVMLDDYTISIDDLANGMYYLRLRNLSEMKTIPFMVRH